MDRTVSVTARSIPPGVAQPVHAGYAADDVATAASWPTAWAWANVYGAGGVKYCEQRNERVLVPYQASNGHIEYQPCAVTRNVTIPAVVNGPG